MKYLLAYDLGTGGTKASLFDENGKSAASAFVGCQTFFPKNGYHEQRPADWWESVVQSTGQLLEKAGIDPAQIVALAVSGHSLGAVPISRDGKLLAEFVPIWSDSRAKAQADKFFTQVDEERWYMTTGNGFPAPLYSIFKIMWYRDECSEIYKNAAKFIGTKDYINFKMTGILCTDRSYASGSGVYSLWEERYLEEYIAASGVDPEKLPEIFPSTHVVGKILPKAAVELGLSPETLVCAGGVDNACMALGAACMEDGDAYTSLGTSGWIAVSSSAPIVNFEKKPYVFAHCVPGQYVSATCIFSAGNSFRWLRDVLYTEDEGSYAEMDKLAASSPAGANGLLFIPTLAGGSGLDKSPNAKGGYAGLELKHTRADMIRSTLEGICLNLRMALDVLAEQTAVGGSMLIVGGGGKSAFWRQLFADIYEKEILESSVGQDAGSLGAAAVAAVGVGLWKDFGEIKSVCQVKKRIEPVAENVRQYRKILPVFEKISEMYSDIGDMISAL